MSKYIVYRDFYQGICMTSSENYYRRLRNASQVVALHGFDTFEQARDYITKYWSINPEDLINKLMEENNNE